MDILIGLVSVAGFGYVAVGLALGAAARIGRKVETHPWEALGLESNDEFQELLEYAIESVGVPRTAPEAVQPEATLMDAVKEIRKSWGTAEKSYPKPAPKMMAPEAVLVVSDAEFVGDVSEVIELETLTIRQLKKLASERKVKGYGKLTKAELVEVLRG
jgi:hypothetical protein